MATSEPSPDALAQLRLGHLNLVQGVVSRLAGFSANVKNFCVTIFLAIAGAAFQYDSSALLLAGAPAVLLFAALDTYYLAQECRFRRFYDAVRDRPLEQATGLDLAPPALALADYAAATRSFSTGGFYALLFASVVLLLFAHGRPEESGRDHSRGTNRSVGAKLPAPGGEASAECALSRQRPSDAGRSGSADTTNRVGNSAQRAADNSRTSSTER